MIHLNNLQLTFSNQIVFEDVSWHIKRQERIGLIGDNGAGKTTLLKTIIQRQQLDSGKLAVTKGVTFGYLPQEAIEVKGKKLLDEVLSAVASIKEMEQEIHELQGELETSEPGGKKYEQQFKRLGILQHQFESLGGFQLETEAKKILSGLGFSETDLEKQVETFSGGWQMRIAMSKLLLQRPSLLLLDEPTNHLDIPTMEWLETYLQTYWGTIIIISHDRYFLERIANKIVLLERGKLYEFSGSFSFFEKKRKLIEEQLWAQYERQKEEVARIERFIERFRYKASKASQVQSRVRQLEKMKRIIPPSAQKQIRFYFPAAVSSGRIVAELSDVSQAYQAKSVIEDVNIIIENNEKIALVGANGAGKSTFCRIVAGIEPPATGTFKQGYRVKTAFYTQETADMLKGDQTVLEEVQSCAQAMEMTRLRTLLGCFLFSGDAAFKPVSVLSGGEKSRLALAKILLQESNFLILDEPTNHLDAASKAVLQEALKAYQGTLILVTHDRYFLDQIITKVIEVSNRHINIYLGNYSEYLERKRALEAASPSARIVPQKSTTKSGKKSKEQKRLEAEARQKKYQKNKKHTGQVKPVESQIEELETRQAELEELMAEPAFFTNGEQARRLSLEYKKISAELPGLYEKWEQLI